MARATVTWQTLRELAQFRAQEGCAISLYLDLDPSTAPTAADAETRLNSLLNEAERQVEQGRFGHDEKQALLRDIEAIRGWWDAEFDRAGLHGVALFHSSLDGLRRTLPFAGTVEDAVRLGRQLFVAPLLPLLGRGDGALVAFVSRERGQVFRLRDGRLVEIVDQSEEQPGQHDQGGWSQGRYQRHIEKLVHDHLKVVGHELDRRLRRAAGLEIVVVAPQELRGELESALSAEARDAIVGWATAEAHATPAELLEVVRPHLEKARAREVTEALDHWRAEAGRNGRAAAGWEQTLEAASDGRVDVLLVQDGANQEAFRCPKCGRGSATGGACPIDGSEREPYRDGLDLALHQVLGYGGAIVPVDGSTLSAEGGIGALLRF